MNAWRLIESPAAAGDWNMAVDAALMDSVAAGGPCTLRFYRWEAPTLSLGYFQAAAQRDEHAPSRDCPLVRRATGGGAIVHDIEITYSLVLPAEHPRAALAQELYQLLHETLVEVLGEWHIAATICPRGDKLSAHEEPFLCFQRRAAGDVLLGESKIAGSAQRRRRGAILQHGSVLLSKSRAAPELFGISDLGGTVVPAHDLQGAWRDRLGRRCEVCWRAEGLSVEETGRAARLVEEIYGQLDWTRRR
ncbi:MAG TPA: biotin/lipoate A/B protein ligase family protein [Pirellulales bacterium]|nr:biotin/lipoate A/B protein ligase family protein [Pirellulales bacterium]